MSTALFYVNPKPPAEDASLSRKSNHLLARIFGDSIISRESFSLPQDTNAVIEKRKKYATKIPRLDATSLEPKLIDAPKDKLADNPNIDDLVLEDMKQMETFQKGVMATLIVAGSALVAWLISSKLSSNTVGGSAKRR